MTTGVYLPNECVCAAVIPISPLSSCSQIDDIFGSSGVNGKENGSAAAAPQPNRVRKQCHSSFTVYTNLHLCPISTRSSLFTVSPLVLCISPDVSDSRGEAALG